MNRVDVQSSNIRSIGYDEKQEVLEIEFMIGAVYEYKAVDVITFNDLMKSDSKGRFFAANIKHNFQCGRL